MTFLSLLYCVTAELMPYGVCVCRCHLSVKHIFSEAIKRNNAKVCGKVAIHHISRPFFSEF